MAPIETDHGHGDRISKYLKVLSLLTAWKAEHLQVGRLSFLVEKSKIFQVFDEGP